MKEVRFGFFPSRTLGLPKKVTRRLFSNLFPEEWDIHLLLRKPMLMEGYPSDYDVTDMYANRIYKKKVSDKDIQKEEAWLGVSFDAIIHMEDLFFHTKFRPTRKRKANMVRHIRFFREFLSQNKINFCMVGYPGEITDITFLYVIKRMKIPYFDAIMPFRLSNKVRYNIMKDSLPVKFNHDAPSKADMERVFNAQKNCVVSRNFFLPEIQKTRDQNFMFNLDIVKMKISQFRDIIDNISEYESQFIIRDLVSIYFKSMLNSKVNNLLFRRYIFEKPKKNEKYFYFPLHYTRDASITVKEPYLNQLNLIKLLSISLPQGVKLYVKCHPHNSGSDFTIWQFREIKALKNVRVIDYRANNVNLMKNSLGVITINSTAGLEAIVLEKPVITFGDEMYASDGMSIVVKDKKRLISILISVMNDPLYLQDPDKRKSFIYDYYMNSFELGGHVFLNSGKDLSEKDFSTLKNELRKSAKTLS